MLHTIFFPAVNSTNASVVTSFNEELEMRNLILNNMQEVSPLHFLDCAWMCNQNHKKVKALQNIQYSWNMIFFYCDRKLTPKRQRETIAQRVISSNAMFWKKQNIILQINVYKWNDFNAFKRKKNAGIIL